MSVVDEFTVESVSTFVLLAKFYNFLSRFVLDNFVAYVFFTYHPEISKIFWPAIC